MYNLISGEFYKWKKSKSFLVCLLGAIAMTLFIFFMLYMAEQIRKGQIENGTGGITVTVPEGTESDEDIMHAIGIMGVIEEVVSNGFALIFLAVFTSIWVVSEYSHGAIKNMAGKGYSRQKVFLAKYLSAAVTAVVMYFLVLLAAVIIGFAFMGTEDVNGPFFQKFFFYTALQLLYCGAFTGIVVCVCEYARNAGVGIGLSMILVIFSSLLTNGLNTMMEFLHLDIKISKYWILDVMSECPMEDFSREFLVRSCLVAIAWIVLSLLLGLVHFRNADIS